MPEYNNCAILFRNFAKKTADHPDLKGTATIDGKPYEVAAWEKHGKRAKFFSVRFTPKKVSEAFTAEGAPEPDPFAAPNPDQGTEEQKGEPIF
jgi:hypothetical protein